jgi:hypothetical protein
MQSKLMLRLARTKAGRKFRRQDSLTKWWNKTKNYRTYGTKPTTVGENKHRHTSSGYSPVSAANGAEPSPERSASSVPQEREQHAKQTRRKGGLQALACIIAASTLQGGASNGDERVI